ncbi:MAG: nucleotide exchange factor GrpE [Alphaproteobacteria bacterium]|nr:nucleotide exchange factor GrpE [Alphaproteobacteria bacterium]MBN2675080.1 nucleotide exchange factor GrpE [Alphaproteobacteria bacterium]
MEEKEIIENQNAEEIKTMETEQKKDSEVESLTVQILELNDKYLRLAAELENTRRRAALDTESAVRNRAISVAEKFLPVMDAITAAVSHAPEDEGIISIAKTLESTLTKIGITKIETVGQQLNPLFHNAIQVVDTPKSDEPCSTKTIPNTIVGEIQPGYMFGDTVMRPAMVIVCK